MKRFYILSVIVLLSCVSVKAQQRVIDAVNNSPVAVASILDAAGNMVGFTFSDGTFSEIPETVYPITLRCLGYEQLVIDCPEEKTWEMIPVAYELDEVVIVPVERNILKQSFYVREYFSLCNKSDTVTFFMEHMADRFVPVAKGVKFDGNSSLRILETHNYSRFKMLGKDSVTVDSKISIPSMLVIFELNDEEIVAPESFKGTGSTIKLHEESGKSGMSLIQKQNAYTFTTIEDVLAGRKEHKYSPWVLKLLGFGMEFNQFYTTQAYRVNDHGVYMSKDLIEAGFVMEADGKGKFFRKALKSDAPVVIRSMIELYIVDRDYLSKEEAKSECKNRPSDVKFVIPANVPPLDAATRQLVERANAEASMVNGEKVFVR